ncbi:MAG: NADH-ubiquinone oxidoreductase-F iron-sulfur binding region domain-containing protein [Acidimicrobiia bacterium]
MTVARVIPSPPIDSFASYVAAGGGNALARARDLGADGILDEIARSGLGGRGGAGFPAGRKWAAVARNHSDLEPSTVVVNAAEGEPGSFKDRAIIRANPHAVVEGALVAALAVGADQVIIATRRTFTDEIAILQRAVKEIEAASWLDGITVRVFEGPEEYLFGEETALLEVIDGRAPFPRIAPPYRRGVDEIVDRATEVDSGSGSASHVELAGATGDSVAPPALASNVETFVHAALIVANGVEWWRAVGTDDSPGTVVCTVSGATQRAGVGEFPMGTPLRDVLEELGGGPLDGRAWVAAAPGVSSPLVLADDFDTPLTHEAMLAIGSGLGTGGFIVLDDEADLIGFAAGVARFLAVESCGQCAACKRDGLDISDALGRLAASGPLPDDLDLLRERLTTVTDGARCNLATQQQVVTESILLQFGDSAQAHAAQEVPGVSPAPIAAIATLVEGRVALEAEQADKQPDWTHDPIDSGQWPADRLDDHREPKER